MPPAYVMLFQQPRSAAGDDAMRAMTRDLIDAALSRGGRRYGLETSGDVGTQAN
jgi:hypothetical protein